MNKLQKISGFCYNIKLKEIFKPNFDHIRDYNQQSKLNHGDHSQKDIHEKLRQIFSLCQLFSR